MQKEAPSLSLARASCRASYDGKAKQGKARLDFQRAKLAGTAVEPVQSERQGKARQG